jgi:hypothetical protein
MATYVSSNPELKGLVGKVFSTPEGTTHVAEAELTSIVRNCLIIDANTVVQQGQTPGSGVTLSLDTMDREILENIMSNFNRKMPKYITELI